MLGRAPRPWSQVELQVVFAITKVYFYDLAFNDFDAVPEQKVKVGFAR